MGGGGVRLDVSQGMQYWSSKLFGQGTRKSIGMHVRMMVIFSHHYQNYIETTDTFEGCGKEPLSRGWRNRDGGHVTVVQQQRKNVHGYCLEACNECTNQHLTLRKTRNGFLPSQRPKPILDTRPYKISRVAGTRVIRTKTATPAGATRSGYQNTGGGYELAAAEAARSSEHQRGRWSSLVLAPMHREKKKTTDFLDSTKTYVCTSRQQTAHTQLYSTRSGVKPIADQSHSARGRTLGRLTRGPKRT